MNRSLASLACGALLAASSLWGCAACGADEPEQAPLNPAFEQWRQEQKTGQGQTGQEREEGVPPPGLVPPPVPPPAPADHER